MAKEMRTGVIKYNIKSRMRSYRGVERDFNIPELVKVINSPEVQERVKQGDLNGFYGHYPRVKFGIEPGESQIENGKMVYLEPCCRTIKLKAYDDGTIEHEQEFFNTELGRKAWERLKDNSGGFSSVISMKPKYGFHGFDFVNEPNYASNRPYSVTFDSTGQSEDVAKSDIFILDDVGDQLQAQYQVALDSLHEAYRDNDILKQENEALHQSLANLEQNSNELLDKTVYLEQKIEAMKLEKLEEKRQSEMTLDSVIASADKFKFADIEIPMDDEDNNEDTDKADLKQAADRVMSYCNWR